MKKKTNFNDIMFQVENDKLEAQLEFIREKNRRQEWVTGGW